MREVCGRAPPSALRAPSPVGRGKDHVRAARYRSFPRARGRCPKGGWGKPLRSATRMPKRLFGPLQHIMVPAGKHMKLALLQPGIAHVIGDRLQILRPIHLDHSRRSTHKKSTTNGPTGCCRQNRKPPSCRRRRRNQSNFSASVIAPRNPRAVHSFASCRIRLPWLGFSQFADLPVRLLPAQAQRHAQDTALARKPVAPCDIPRTPPRFPA